MSYFEGISTLAGGKRRYKALSKQLHPDVGGSAEEMLELNLQWEAFQKIILRMPPPPKKPRRAPQSDRQAEPAKETAPAPIARQEPENSARQARKQRKMKKDLHRLGVSVADFLIDTFLFDNDQ